MAAAFDSALRRSPAALLVGTDCPALTPRILRRAAAVLARADAVFVPAEDGGYVLVGLRRFAPGVFVDIDWGTDRVWAQTRRRLQAQRLRWTGLPPLRDLDRPEDLCQPLPPGISRRIAALRRNRRTPRRPGSPP
jgi:glycosyltransferase A (GT-A) superfamily protein (DUF2064 family)